MNRQQRRSPEGRKLLNMAGQEFQLQGTPEEQLAAEAQLAAAADNPQSSFATTISVLAHTWFTLDQAREAARMTYKRAIQLREKGRQMSTTTVVQQYEQAQAEIEIVEAQIVETLQAITASEDDGVDAAFGLLAAAHTNMQSGISVRIPQATQVRLALGAGILAQEEVLDPSGTAPSDASTPGAPEDLPKTPMEALQRVK